MILKHLATMALGAALVLSAGGVRAEPSSPVKVAAVADNPAPKPAPVKKKQAAKKKKTVVAKKAEPEPEKPKGLFSALFKPAEPEKPAKPLTKAEKAKAAKEKAAREKAEKAERLAAEKAAKDAKVAAEKARQEKIRAAEEAEFSRVKVLAAAAKSNDGELRSETKEPQGLFGAMFGKPETALLPETKALDAALAVKDKNKKFRVKSDFVPQTVSYSGYKRGQIVIDTEARYLYLIESGTSARRYAIAVGKDGLQFKGNVTVGDKQEWPRWIPTKEMQKRDPAKYGQYADGMPGGPENPLGARAIYLYQGKQDTHLRIHGTNAPETIGTSASNGCFRMVNEHVMDLYTRVKKGTEVIVM